MVTLWMSWTRKQEQINFLNYVKVVVVVWYLVIVVILTDTVWEIFYPEIWGSETTPPTFKNG